MLLSRTTDPATASVAARDMNSTTRNDSRATAPRRSRYRKSPSQIHPDTASTTPPQAPSPTPGAPRPYRSLKSRSDISAFSSSSSSSESESIPNRTTPPRPCFSSHQHPWAFPSPPPRLEIPGLSRATSAPPRSDDTGIVRRSNDRAHPRRRNTNRSRRIDAQT